MTTSIAKVSDTVARQAAGLAGLTDSIRTAGDIRDLTEARARIEAARAWAKVHGQVKQMRLELLTVEVEALVRIIELGGGSTLSAKDRKAAEWLHAMTPGERTKLLSSSGSATTAAGMCNSIWREAEIKRERVRFHDAGVELATNPQPPVAVYDEAAINTARGRANDLSGVLADIAETYINNGASFTVDELAEHIIEQAGIDPDIAEDEAFNEGVKEVCRRTIRSAPPLSIDGTIIPRLITARIDGGYTRIPVMNATMAHLDDMIATRQAQIAQDQAALDQLIKVAAKLRACPGGESEDARIGDLIGQTVTASSPEERLAS